MTFEKKGIAAFFAGAILVLGGGYTARILMDDVPSAATREYRRMVADQEEVTKVKCTEPMAEFQIAETKYLQTYGLLFQPTEKYDILSSTDEKNAKQVADANDLKLNEEMAFQSCADAKVENVAIKPANNWDYFKAHWKEMMFNVK